jgi:hypothetical protein
MTAYLRPEKEMVGDGNGFNSWSFPADRRETLGFSKFNACPAFVVPSDSEAFNKSGLEWACGGKYHVQIQKPGSVIKAEFANEPFTDLRWVGIDSRCEGGVAYKVVTPQGWLVDLREDVVTECLYEGAITHKISTAGSGTYFTAEFVWVVMGSQSRLVRVDSKLYEEILESVFLKCMGPIPADALEVGGIYQKANGRQVVLVGIGTEKGKKFLVAELSQWDRQSVQSRIDVEVECLNPSRKDCWPSWHFSGSLKVNKQVGQVKVPPGMMEAFRKKAGRI